MLAKFLRTTLLAISLALGSSALAHTTVTLQQGLNGYANATDTWLNASSPDANNGTGTTLTIGDTTQAGALVRFAIFQREGGPVPDNALIVSATLSLYKFNGPDGLFKATPLARDWRDGEATWNVFAAGSPWVTPGALSPYGTCNPDCTPDIFEGGGHNPGQAWVGNADVDACAAAPFPDSCWVNIDVFLTLKTFSEFGVPNFGWRVGQVRSTGNTQTKDFYSKDNTAFPSLRPKLTVTYATAVSVTLIQSSTYSGTSDGWINASSPDANDGSSQGLTIRDTRNVALMRFKIFQSEGGPVPNGATVRSAMLSLYKWGGPDAVIKAQRLLRPWDESQFTWNAAAGGAPWATAGALGASDVLAGFDGQGSVGDAAANNCTSAPFADACWLNIDVTMGAQAFASAPAQNFGWRLGQVSSSGNATPKSFNTKENVGFPALRPKLTITYVPEAEFQSPKIAVAAADGETRPTFHSMSLYWNPPGFSDASPPPGSRIFVRYRKATENPDAPGFAWKQPVPMWYDVRNATEGWGTLPYAFRGRGSVVYLTPGTKYIFELGTGTDSASAAYTHHLVGTTQSEIFREGLFQLDMPPDPPTTIAPRAPADGPLVITEGGNSSSYRVYDGWNSATGTKNVIDRGGANQGASFHTNPIQDASFAIVVKASYVIIRRVVVKGAALSNIYIYPDVTDVVIEDCDISDWTWRADPNAPAPIANWGPVGTNEAGGVHLSGNNSRIVVQRNRIFDPHYGANPWEFGHPWGPLAITTWHGGRQNVFRYNEIYSTIPDRKHWFEDAISGAPNFSDTGSPGSDSDVYHNNIRNVMDDAIEAEGGGLNVRVWGNYIDHSLTGVATTAVHLGPTYVFRNVVNRLRAFYTRTVMEGNPPRLPDNGIAEPDDDFHSRGETFKAYGRGHDCNNDPIKCPWWGGGRRYFFNNTQLQQPRNTYDPVQQWGDLGSGGGIMSSDGPQGDPGQGLRETVSRNNILDTYRPGNEPVPGGLGVAIYMGADGTATNDLNFDLWSGQISSNTPPFEANGIQGRPTFRSGHGWMAFPRFSSAANEAPETIFGTGLGVAVGAFQLNTTGSLGLNAGQPLPNFSFDIDNPMFARKSGVELSGTNPDVGAHDSASQETMKFGVFAGP